MKLQYCSSSYVLGVYHLPRFFKDLAQAEARFAQRMGFHGLTLLPLRGWNSPNATPGTRVRLGFCETYICGLNELMTYFVLCKGNKFSI